MTVYDGEDTDSNVIAQYCRFHNSEEIISFTNQMLVVFTSDSRLQEQGFAASYEFIGKTSAATHPRNVNDSTKREALHDTRVHLDQGQSLPYCLHAPKDKHTGKRALPSRQSRETLASQIKILENVLNAYPSHRIAQCTARS